MEFRERGFHLRAGVVVTFFLGNGDTGGKYLARFGRTGIADQELGELIVRGDIFGMLGYQVLKMLLGSRGISSVHAFKSQTIP